MKGKHKKTVCNFRTGIYGIGILSIFYFLVCL